MESFRVRGKIFATVPDATHLRVMVDELGIRAAVAGDPGACQELYWGHRLAGVVVDLRRASTDLVRELLTDAWVGKAPKKLARELTDDSVRRSVNSWLAAGDQPWVKVNLSCSQNDRSETSFPSEFTL